MFQQFTVVDYSYIQRRYQLLGVIGKGRDFIYDLSSTISLVRERSTTFKDESSVDDGKGKTFSLQVYNSLPIDIYKKKVSQLQLAMSEYITNLTPRIVLLGQKRVNDGTFDLYVIYDVDKLTEKTLEQDLRSRVIDDKATEHKFFDEKEAKELLQFLAQNILYAGRYTFEFLDVSPANISLNTQSNPKHGKYIINNYGISYYGTKFYRRYTCPSDPFFEELVNEHTAPNVIFTYAFQAALVTLQAMTGVSTKDFFQEDNLDGKQKYTYNQEFLMSLLKYIKNNHDMRERIQEKEKEKDAEKDPKKAQELAKLIEQQKERLELKKEKLFKRLPSLSRKLVFQVFSAEFIDLLSKLLTSDYNKRSVFLQLITYPTNIFKLSEPLLSGKHPWVIPGMLDAKKTGQYFGMGKPIIEESKDKEKDKVHQLQNNAQPDGNGQCRYTDPENKEHDRFGFFNDGKPAGLGCIEIKGRRSYVTGVWKSAASAEDQILYELDKFVYFGPVDDNFLPNGEGRMASVQPPVNPLKPSRIPIFFEGKFEKGIPASGKMWFKDGNCYEGPFKDGQINDVQGSVTYKEPKHTFKGTFLLGMRAKGVLNYSNGWVFEGSFKNDHIKQGTMIYKTKAKYTGNFKKLLRHDEKAVYVYEDGVTRYEGPFQYNVMHGNGRIFYKMKDKDGKEQEASMEVRFEEGKVVHPEPEKIPDQVKKVLLKIKEEDVEVPKEDKEQ